MPQTPDWTKFLDAGVEFVALTRGQARARAKELVGQGQLAQSQVQGFVDDLVDESRRRTDNMMDVVRQEIARQVKVLGIATKDDLVRLETKLAGGPGAKKKTAKKTVAKKSVTKKRAAVKKTAKKTAVKKSAKKTPTRAAKAS